ncbi:Calmodulin-binding transcription activator 2 [Senna tora]|uniref:Calmodulin-binding transcription activator 2 n=1 Tax=Senna tora TaxID=362788 RepID=A0A834W2T6_9FABA|nr:Calmodulin-binding transcription activator 2 [Senna tora]
MIDVKTLLFDDDDMSTLAIRQVDWKDRLKREAFFILSSSFSGLICDSVFIMAERGSFGLAPRLAISTGEWAGHPMVHFPCLIGGIQTQHMMEVRKESNQWSILPIDIQQLQFEAQHRWLRPAEICEILRNYQMFHITPEPPNRPPSGSLFLFDRKVLRYFRKDAHNWRKKKDGKTVKEAHEKLKVGSIDVLHCYYAHGEENENFQRRSYWLLEQDMMHIVFVHYLEVKWVPFSQGNKTNIGGKPNINEVSSDSQKGSSASSSFLTNYSTVPSRSTDSMSPTSTLTSLCEDADSGNSAFLNLRAMLIIDSCPACLKIEDIHQANSALRLCHDSPSLENVPPMDKSGAASNNSYLLHPFSGDHGQSSISGIDYTTVQRDKSKRSYTSTSFIEDQKTNGMALWDNVFVSLPSIPSSLIGNILEQEHTVPGDPLTNKSVLTRQAESSQSCQSNCQIPFENNPGQLVKWSTTQTLGLEFGSDFSNGLVEHETHSSSPDIAPELVTYDGQPKEEPVLENFPDQHTYTQSQILLKSNFENEVSTEESINYASTVRRTLLNGEESLKKVDSFSRWITKALEEVDDLHMQSSPGISWSTDECGHVIDDSSLSPSLSQDQLFSINVISPKWAYAELETEVLIIGTFLKSQSEVANYNWSCMFGEVEVPAQVLANGILCCHAPPHKAGRFPFYVTCSNRLACSEVREFDYTDGFAKDVDISDFCNSSTETLLHLRLDKLLSSKSACSLNHIVDSDMVKRNLLIKLISLKEEEDFSNMEDPTSEMDASQHKVKEQLFYRKVKEKLYSWLLHKVTEDGKGPNVVDEEGQGVLHLVSALGCDWAIMPIITAGVNINFRDVKGWTALHWAASCGRERTVAVLVSMDAATGALTDPSPEFPSGRTPADLASSNGHKGISGFLAESSLTSHLSSLTMNDLKKDFGQRVSEVKTVQTVSERIATPGVCGDPPDALCLKDSLTAVRNATQAADRIHQVFRMQSFQRKQLTLHEDDEFGLSDQQALSLLVSKTGKAGQGEGLAHTAAVQIQKKFRGWKKRKEFLIIRQRIVKIQAHVRGHQVRKKYKSITWSVGILEKVILRWRRKGSGLRGFRPDAANKITNHQNDSLVEEDDYDFLKEGRKQSEERFQKALCRVKSMVQYPEARAQYRRLLNVAEDFRQTKACNMDVINSEEAVDGVDDLIDIEMLLDDDNFIPIAFD